MKKVLLSAALLLGFVGIVVADPFPATMAADGWDPTPDAVTTPRSNNDGVPDLYNVVNRFVGTTYTSNAALDSRWIQPNDLFNTGAGGSSTVALVGLTAANHNTLGYYLDGTPGVQNDLIVDQSGFGDRSGPVATFSTSGSFGFYLRVYASDGTTYLNTFYSQPSLNGDRLDHLVSYRVAELDNTTIFGHTFNTAYLMGWEDIAGGGDQDYDDMMYLMDVRPAQVPEPGVIGMLGLGLLAVAGTGAIGRKRK